MKKILLVALLFSVFGCSRMSAQLGTSFNDLLTPADTLNKARFQTAVIAASVNYTAFSIALYNTWYKQFPRERFHSFNDWNEWNNIDKAGHLYTTYFQSVLCYKTAKWTGLNDDGAILTGILCGTLFQTTVEVMDGFSSKWGFSWSDMGANTLGTAAFGLQQKFWQEQRITFKVSSQPKDYSNQFFTQNGQTFPLRERTDDLFGTGYSEQFLKDYNAQTIWASFNLNSLLQNDKIPAWLNVAVGYGSENMFGGFANEWQDSAGNSFVADASEYPRYQQFYLAPDIDLTRIKTKSPLLKTILSVLNVFKLPTPAMEYNSLGELKWHWLHY